MATPNPPMVRLMRKVVRVGACLEIHTNLDSGGYPMTRIGGRGTKKVRCSRVVMEHHHGPSDLHVLHTCDNTRCVEIEHLYYGTPKDNHRDMVARDRHTRGERSGTAKLTEAQVLAIRDDPRVQTVIAAEYGIGQMQVSRIKRRERWSYL